MTVTVLTTAHEFIDRLDRNDASALADICDRTGTWWVDTGLDRAAGVPGHDPGADRPWPLHGAIELGERSSSSAAYPTDSPAAAANGDGTPSVTTITRWSKSRVTAGTSGQPVTPTAMHLSSTAPMASFATYTSTLTRLARGQRVPGSKPRTSNRGPHTSMATIDPGGPLTDLALEFAAAITSADPERVLAISEPSATWWADSGPGPRPRTARCRCGPGGRPLARRQGDPRGRVASLPGLVSTFSGGWSLAPQRVTEGASSVRDRGGEPWRAPFGTEVPEPLLLRARRTAREGPGGPRVLRHPSRFDVFRMS